MCSSIQRAVMNIRGPVKFNGWDFAFLQDLMMALEPVKLAVEALC